MERRENPLDLGSRPTRKMGSEARSREMAAMTDSSLMLLDTGSRHSGGDRLARPEERGIRWRSTGVLNSMADYGRLVIALTLLSVACCFGHAYHEEICEGYVLVAVDTMNQLMLGHETNGVEGVVSAAVFAVGVQDPFIIVKQHPAPFPGRPNKEVTNYFIVVMPEDRSRYPRDGVFGPLTKQEFAEMRAELGVPEELKFTKYFAELD